MSHGLPSAPPSPLPSWLLRPYSRWSFPLIGAALHTLFCPASAAGLLTPMEIVHVGPPLSWSAPKKAFIGEALVPVKSEPMKPLHPSATRTRFVPPDTMVPLQSDGLPTETRLLAATSVLVSVITPPDET